MVSALDSDGPGSSPGQDHRCVLRQDTYTALTVPLSTQEYKCRGTGDKMLGQTYDGLAFHPGE